MKIGRKIGEGGTSEVFEWEDHTKVVKLAKDNISKWDLEREYKNNLAAWKRGLPVPQPYEIVEVNGRPGMVFERVYGESLKDRFFKSIMEQINIEHPKLEFHDVRRTARLLHELHQLSLEELPPQREFLNRQIMRGNYLSEGEKRAVLDLLETLPIKKQLCHGDPNPNNMIMSNEKLILIDWNDATSGNPEADLAEYILMIRYTVLPPDTPKLVMQFFDSIREHIIHIFIEEYSQLTGISNEEIEPWIVPIATRKLSADAISEEEKKLLVKEIRLRLGRINR